MHFEVHCGRPTESHGGRSFDYLLTGPYETMSAFVTGKDEFVIFTAASHRSDSSAGVYRWLLGE
jgi:hypothetical protein